MADQLPDEARLNSTRATLTDLQAGRLSRVPPRSTLPAYTTLPDGRVLDKAGNVVYEPGKVELKP